MASGYGLMKGVRSYCDSIPSRWGWSWRMYDLVVVV